MSDEYEGVESVKRLSRDLKKASLTLSPDQARFLVGQYYTMQANRIRADNQVRSLKENEEPHAAIEWLSSQNDVLERSIKNALDSFSNASVLGRWAKSICGIGPVITAGFLAHISMEPWRCHISRNDITKKPCNAKDPHGPLCRIEQIRTVGHIWRFAGLDPTVIWEPKTRRPWNADLKTLTWKLGESFVKVSTNDADFYGHLLVERKNYEIANNFSGKLVQQAIDKLAKYKIGKDTDAYAWYSGCLTPAQALEIAAAPAAKRLGMVKKMAGIPGSGLQMLPPAHIHARAKRWAVKLFLSHYHAVAHMEYFHEPAPKPYILTHDHGHTHEIVCPNWPF